MDRLRVTLIPYVYQLKHSFNLAIYRRNITPAVFLKLETNNHIAWGEASLPPYLGETQESVISFIQDFNLERFSVYDDISIILNEADEYAHGNNAAKAAIDIALHDLKAKLNNISCGNMFRIKEDSLLPTSYTIGIDTPDNIRMRAEEASGFRVIKIKLGGTQDREMIKAIRKTSNKPIYADVNQGWKTVDKALKESEWLAENGVVLIEQPFQKEWLEETARFREQSLLPLFADESCRRLEDVERVYAAFDGINIKLMKSTGMSEAYKMISLARKLKLKVMLGSMTESSVATLAANVFAPLADHLDLDGPWLIINNPFKTPVLENGILISNKNNGIGAIENSISIK